MILLYFLSLITVFFVGQSKKLSVTSISTLDSQLGSFNLFGSSMGGTVLYIKGTGFHQNPSLNYVFVGDYPCIVPQEGSKEETLLCTTSSIFPRQNLYNQTIVIISNKQKVTAIQKFSYLFEHTPQLHETYPSHSYANMKIRLIGTHKIYDLGDGTKPGKIKAIYIGNQVCSRNGIKQNPITSLTTNQSIQCIQAPISEAGKYSIKQHLDIGYANNSKNLLKTSLYGPKYEFAILPTVESFSPNNGSIGGQQLTIKGTGFPESNKDKNKIKVTLDNTECQIVQTSTNEIRCNLKKRSSETLRIQNSLNLSDYSYISGSGFKYFIYDHISDIQTFQNLQNTSPSNFILNQSGIKGELQSVNYQQIQGVQIMQGYFYAPYSGKYTFIGVTNTQFKLYFNPNPGNPSIKKQDHLLLTGKNNSMSQDPYSFIGTPQSKNIDLQEGKYYFMKTYFKRNQLGDKFKVLAEVPNQNKELGWKAPQIQKITLNFTNQPLIYRFRSLGAISGFIKLSVQIINPNTLAVIVNISTTLPFDASPEMVCAAILQIQSSYTILNNDPKCELYYLDENLDRLPAQTPKSQVFGYEWIVKYFKPLIEPIKQSQVVVPLNLLQVTYIAAESFNGDAPYFTHEKLQDQGPLINGTFNIISKGSYINYTYWSVDFPYNVNATTLQYSLKKFYNYEKIVVTESDHEPAWYGKLGKTWTIQYNQPESQFTNLQFVTDRLTGGQLGTQPQVYFEDLKKYGTNLLYDPLSFELMKTFTKKPSIVVKVNDISSFCVSSSCQFAYLDEAPKVSYLSMNSTSIVISLSTQVLKTTSKVQIRINDQNLCNQIIFVTNSSINCVSKLNEDGNTLVPAGSYHPSIYLQGIGYLEYESNVPQLSFQFSLMNPSPVNGSVLGSFPITLKGKGLPKNPYDLSIKICDIETQILQITDSSVTFRAPQIKQQFTEDKLNCSIKVQNAKYNPSQVFDGGYFIYEKQLSPPTILSLSKKQSNPTKKGVLDIYGSGFDSNHQKDPSTVNVFLKGIDIDKRYQLKVLEVNDTQVKAGLSGGVTGNFQVQVEIKGIGLAKVPNQQSVKFYYVNTIENILPSQGSYFGGRQIQILGNSFSTDIYENEVQIGGQVCSMIEASDNKLKCLTPAKDDKLNDPSAQVKVISRQISESVCNGICTFSYMSVDNSPVIFSSTLLSTDKSDQEVTIEGRNLFKQNLGTQVIVIHRMTKSKFTFSPLYANDTHVIWKTNSIPAGQYFLFINVKNVGYSNMTIFTIRTVISSVTAALSIQGGFLSIRGFGFPEKLDEQPFELQILESISKAPLQPKIIEATSDLIRIHVSSRNLNEKLQINFIKSFYQKSTYFVEFVDIKTPKAKLESSPLVPWKNTEPIIISMLSGMNYIPETVKLSSILQPDEEIEVTWDKNDTHIRIQNNLQPGTYRFKIFNSEAGYYQINETLTIQMANIVDIFKFSSNSLSVEGGYIFIENTANSLPQFFGKHSSILVNGEKTQIIRVNETSFKLSYPPFVRSNKKYLEQISKTDLNLEEKQRLQELNEGKQQKDENIVLSSYLKWSDQQNDDLTNTFFDSLTKTTYYSSNAQCYVAISFGNHHEIQISKIKYYPNKTWVNPGKYLKGAKFEGSSDNVTWKEIKILDTKVERGWNKISLKKNQRSSFKYFRFIHNSNSGCSLGQLEIRGTKINNNTFQNPISPLTQRSVILSYSDGLKIHQWTDIVFTYSDLQTPVIQNVVPPRGSVKGGQTIQLHGNSLDSGTPEVIIDNKFCQILEFNSTFIKCRTSPRLQTPKKIMFQILVNGKAALIKQAFRYVYRWSDQSTWGVDLPPVEGDLIYVPQNMHLYIDQSTPKLAGIIAENSTIQISDQIDIQVHTANIILTGATLLAGTALKPYQHKLTFNFYGSEGQNQIPFFGNKGIGCSNCKLILHGAQKQAYTRVNSINEGQTHITSTYPQPLGWQIGDQIVVASSSWNYIESQKLTIKEINKTSTLLNLWTDEPLKYNHLSFIEKTKSSDEVFIGAQIASLTRNIKMQGDSNSEASQYGIHLTFIGNEDSGLQVKISNVELKNCGQPKKSRHCINFNRNSDLPTSYIINSTASQTYAKFMTLSSTNFLRLSSNVGYRVKGHNIELKDGTEQNNIIEGNLMITSLPYYRDLQTDVMVASYYISNPNNIIRDNIAAGSYYYGFLYDLKTKKQDGIYAKDPLCTAGYPVSINKGNVAHSVSKIGVRIKDLITRANPCEPTRDDLLLDPWSVNPSKQSLFENYVIYKVAQLGLMCDSIGHVKFNNFTMVQNNRSHVEFHLMNFTRENVVVSNSTFIGVVDVTKVPVDMHTKGLILPRSGSINVSNVLFNKYSENQTLIQTCSLCDDVQYYTNNGQEYFFDKVQYQNIQKATYLQMLGLGKEIIYDNDGTFTSEVFDNTVRTKATVVKGFQHILSQPGCNLSLNQTSWDKAAVCGSNLTIRKITFMNIMPMNSSDLYAPYVSRISGVSNQQLKEQQIPTTINNTPALLQIPNSWSAPFITGSKYQIRSDYQFDNISVQGSSLLQQSDGAIVLRFFYTLTTQLFDVYKIRNLNRASDLINNSNTALDSSICKNGESYHNNQLREFDLCVSGKDRTLYQLIEITPVFCRYQCPKPPIIIDPPTPSQPVNPSEPTQPTQPLYPPEQPPIDLDICIKQNYVRQWSNSSQWSLKRLPIQGQNITVHCNWTMELDIDPPPAAQIIIDGTLIIPQNRQLVNITAQSLWVRIGALLIGNQTDSFDKNLVIQLNGKPQDPGYSVDANYAGRKNLLVTGRLQIYGPTNYDESTFLIQDAQPGSNTIKVNNLGGWKVGDQIVLSTSSHSWNHAENVKITAIDGQSVEIYPSLTYFHHGSSLPAVGYQNSQLFTATKVIYVSRNIKIIAGPAESFGFSAFVYGYVDPNKNTQMGSVYLRGVQFRDGGQKASGPSVLGFKNTVSSTKPSYVSKCSFVKCGSECVTFNNAKNLVFENNVLYDAIRSHIRAENLRMTRIQGNIMIKSRKDQSSSQKLSVCLQNRVMLNSPYVDNVTIQRNECYGSQQIGFILPYLPCSKKDWQIKDNIAGGCSIGFYMVRLQRQTEKCLICDNQIAFNCQYGVVGNPIQTNNLTYNKLILIGNQQGLILRFTSKQKNNTAYVINSYISAVSNPNCLNCNLLPEKCSNLIGIRLLSVTQTGPGIRIGFNSSQIRSSSPIDGKTFIQNTEFAYFKSDYSSIEKLKNCKNNFIFKAHEQAIDFVGSTHLYDSSLIECDKTSLVYFRPFDNKYLGLEGGCGQFNCTSLENYFVQDHSGQILGSKGSKVLPNNLYFSNKILGCEYKELMNGYQCDETQEVAVLQFESIARDFNSRIVWPIFLISQSNDGINNTLNVEKQWSYRNGYPEGKRKARTNSLIKLNTTYNLTFYSRAPADLIFQIQQKSPTVEDFAWIKLVLQYPDQNSIRIKANDKDINPIILLDNKAQSDPQKQTCGSYKYVYNDKYIEFILTTDCKVRLSFVSSVKATIRLDQAVNDFFTNNGTGKFIDKMCAILGITDTSRLKIVGVYTGSTIVDFYIQEQQKTTQANSTSAPSSSESVSSLQQISQQLDNSATNGELQTALSSAGFGSIISVSSTVVLVNETGQFQTDQNQTVDPVFGQNNESSSNNDNSTIIIIVSVVSAVVILALSGTIVYLKFFRKQPSIENEPAIIEQVKQEIGSDLDKEVSIQKSEQMTLSYFQQRKKYNLENMKKRNSKIKKTKFQNIENNSNLTFKNPFDEHYLPKESHQKIGQASEDVIQTQKIYKQ